MELSSEGQAILRAQQGMLTRRQLLEAGVTKAEIRLRLGARWRMLLPKLVLLDLDLPTQEQRLLAVPRRIARVGATRRATREQGWWAPGPSAGLGGQSAVDGSPDADGFALRVRRR